MDGLFLMAADSDLIRELVSRIAPALVADPNRYSELWDLDEVFWKDYPKPWDLGRAAQAFAALVNCYSPWSSPLAANLQIWLEQASDLVAAAPEMDSMESLDVSIEHPPGIGLSKKIRPQLPVRYERYQRPVQQAVIQVSSGEIHAYYECFRMPDAINSDEPYDRIVVFQHWMK
jgi:hypothetical protein